MSYPIAGGMPNYSSTGTTKWIPEIWSTKLIRKFYDSTLLAAISNTEYEGEIKNQGDKIIIRTTPTVTIKDYIAGQKLDYERHESASLELLIDKGKYFAFAVDDVMKYQADIGLMDNWSSDAAEQMKIVIDTQVLSTLYTDCHAKNKGNSAGRISGNIALGVSGTPLGVTKTNILDTIIDMGLCMDEQNLPETGRFCVIPAWASAMIKKSDIKDSAIGGDSGGAVVRNGKVGTIDRFTLYSSNLLPTGPETAGTSYYCYFGIKYGLTFATQITKMETLRAESTFGDLLRSVQIYGFKVIKPEALGAAYIYKA